MMKKITLLFVAFLLIFSNLTFAQVENPYQDFNPESLKNNKNYAKNFAPNNFSEKILYACMQDVINAAREQYAYLPAMKTDIRLDSAALMQAVYQAEKEEKTIENVSPYRTTEQRLKKYGLSERGKELASKAKATLGDKEYSYFDVCLELIKPLLKNAKTAAVLLDRQYTYVGFGYEFDKYMKSIYASFVFGNDRTFNDGKPAPSVRDVPFTRKSLGLAGYDEQLCKKCMTDKGLEILSECLSVKDGEVLFSHDDSKVIRKLIGKEGDAIVLDFVQHSQYNGDGEDVVDHDRPNHGFMTKIITYEQMLAANSATGKKTTKLLAHIADVPAEIPADADFDINIIIVKDGKYVCRDVLKKNVECKNSAYQESFQFIQDQTPLQGGGEWVPVSETNTVEVSFPIEDSKTTYTYEDLRSHIEGKDKPAAEVLKVEIAAVSSFKQGGGAKGKKAMETRANSIANAIKKQFPDKNIPVDITYDDGWSEVADALRDNPDWSWLADETSESAQQIIKYNPSILDGLGDKANKPSSIKVKITVKYSVEGANEQPFVLNKFNKAIASKKYPFAISIYKFIEKRVSEGAYPASLLDELDIPQTKEFQPLLINRIQKKCERFGNVNDQMAAAMIEVCALNLTTPAAKYNKVVAEVASGAAFADANDIANRQAAIDNLYTISQLPQDKVNDLNMEFQFQILDYLKNTTATPELVILKDNTYAKIKAIRNPKMSSWKNAYKLAAIFVGNGDYVYAVGLMEPFLRDETISNDFLFSFISLSAVREELYMSGNFTYAVEKAVHKDGARLCGMFDKLPVVIFDNQDVKKIIFKECGR